MSTYSINQVITRLEEIIQYSIRNNIRTGYFAVLYHRVTCRIKDGIENGEFEDSNRMEKLDVIFAWRYINAWEQWISGGKPSASWKAAFEAAENQSLIILQHLLLGINAHINLDLGIAAMETMKDEDLQGIRKDFVSINNILKSLVEEIQSKMSRVSPIILLLNLHKTNHDEMLIEFSINTAREGAWCFANELKEKTGSAFQDCCNLRDNRIAQIGARIANPGRLLRFTLRIIRLFEWNKPSVIISRLNHIPQSKTPDLIPA